MRNYYAGSGRNARNCLNLLRPMKRNSDLYLVIVHKLNEIYLCSWMFSKIIYLENVCTIVKLNIYWVTENNNYIGR